MFTGPGFNSTTPEMILRQANTGVGSFLEGLAGGVTRSRDRKARAAEAEKGRVARAAENDKARAFTAGENAKNRGASNAREVMRQLGLAKRAQDRIAEDRRKSLGALKRENEAELEALHSMKERLEANGADTTEISSRIEDAARSVGALATKLVGGEPAPDDPVEMDGRLRIVKDRIRTAVSDMAEAAKMKASTPAARSARRASVAKARDRLVELRNAETDLERRKRDGVTARENAVAKRKALADAKKAETFVKDLAKLSGLEMDDDEMAVATRFHLNGATPTQMVRMLVTDKVARGTMTPEQGNALMALHASASPENIRAAREAGVPEKAIVAGAEKGRAATRRESADIERRNREKDDADADAVEASKKEFAKIRAKVEDAIHSEAYASMNTDEERDAFFKSRVSYQEAAEYLLPKNRAQTTPEGLDAAKKYLMSTPEGIRVASEYRTKGK